MAKTGRPKIEISQEDFEKLCAIWANEEEIAGWFNCSVDTLSRWCKRTYKTTFADIYKQKASVGAISLRRKQFELAQKGNVTLLIWLGKQKLGQHEPRDLGPGVATDVGDDAEILIEFQDEAPPKTS